VPGEERQILQLVPDMAWLRQVGAPAHDNLEKPVTGAAADKARAAAVKAVGGGTAGAVTTDVSGNGYEVTVTKSDGSKVEVHLDQSFSFDDQGRLGG
jgi:hypothetical protein